MKQNSNLINSYSLQPGHFNNYVGTMYSNVLEPDTMLVIIS